VGGNRLTEEEEEGTRDGGNASAGGKEAEMNSGEQIGPEVELPGREVFREDDPRFQGIATARGYGQEQHRIQKVRYSHEAMIDVILAEPTITQAQLATKFGVTQTWISRIYGSDAFQAVLAKRRAELIDPILIATMEDQIKGVAHQSLEIIAQKLEATQSADLALKSFSLMSTAMGFGVKDRGPAVQQNFVVNLPRRPLRLMIGPRAMAQG
jgi:hypothetical protein